MKVELKINDEEPVAVNPMADMLGTLGSVCTTNPGFVYNGSKVRDYVKQPNKSVKAIYINEKKKTVVVKLKDGTVKSAKCSPMDEFDANVGFAIAFTRAYFGSREKLENVVASKTASVIKADPVAEEKPAKRKYTHRKNSAK